MREKKNWMILTFSTTTEAMKMEDVAARGHIPGRLIPTPREITAGCGLAWKMSKDEYEDHENKLDHLGILFEQRRVLYF